MEPVPGNQSLSSRTVLVSPNQASGELATELGRLGAHVLTWPTIDVGEPDNYEALDEAIENLFGYDWLILRNVNAVEFFLRRFQTLGHDISELDALRSCVAGEKTVGTLEKAHVHVDVIPDRLSSRAIFDAIETYAGGRDELPGLNFLIPSAGISGDYLPEALADAGGRVDLVRTYRTCAGNDSGRTNALLTGGGVDCVVFTSASEVYEFADVFDTNDLGRLLAGVAVTCIDEETARAAAALDLGTDIIPKKAEAPAQAISLHFSR